MTEDGSTLVVGFGRGTGSREALRAAMDVAGRMGAGLRVVHVADLDDYPVDPDAIDWEQRGEAELARTEQDARDILAEWTGDWRYEARRGDPVQALLEVAEEDGAVMIVVGGSGRGMGSALTHLFGAVPSMAERLRRGSVPVLVVPVVPSG